MYQEGPSGKDPEDLLLEIKQCAESLPTPEEELKKSPLFASCSSSFLSELILVAQCEFFQPGENVWLQGEECTKLYFLKAGEVELLNEDHKVLHKWSAGSMLGLCVLLSVHHRMRTARAADVCECLTVPAASFHAILRQHPHEKKHFLEVAHAEGRCILGDRQFEVLVSPPLAPPTHSAVVRRKSFSKSPVATGEEDKSPKRGKALSKLPTIEPVTKQHANATKRLIPTQPKGKGGGRRPFLSKQHAIANLMGDDSDSDDGLNAVSAQWSERQVSTQSCPDTMGMNWGRSSTVPVTAIMATESDGTHSHKLAPPGSPRFSPSSGDQSSAASPSPTPSGTASGSKNSSDNADALSPTSRKAENWCEVIKESFSCLDVDQNGRIDREEFKHIAENLSAAFAWDDHQSALLLQEIDHNNDEQVDLPEFADWLTNVHATMTFSPDGWLQTYDLADTLQPLYECYDPDDSGINKDHFLKTYRIMANALKHTPVAHQKKADAWVRAAEEEFENLNDGKDRPLDIDDFIQWQAQLLKHSGIPNCYLPERVAALAKALKVIMELDRKPSLESQDEALLSKWIHKVATLARELYLPCSEQLRKLLADAYNKERKEPLLDEDYKWENLPEGAINRLRRDCAINMGVLLPGVLPQKSGETSKGDVWRFARRNSHLRNRMNTPVLGELLLCFHSTCAAGDSTRFFAWLEAPRKSETDRNMYYELVPRSDGCGKELEPTWIHLPDGTAFHAELGRLPKDQALLALLKTQELAHGELQWPQLQKCLGLAQELNFMTQQDSAQVTKVVQTFARQYVVQQPWHREQLDMGMSMSEIVNEHLEEAAFSPEDVLQLLLDQQELADAQPEPKGRLAATLTKMLTRSVEA